MGVPTADVDGCDLEPDAGLEDLRRPPELPAEARARIDLLHKERVERALRRRPDRPPEAQTGSAEAAAAEAADDVWNDLLDLTSEALEIFIRFRNAVGVEVTLLVFLAAPAPARFVAARFGSRHVVLIL